MPAESAFAGDAIAPGAQIIKVRVAERMLLATQFAGVARESLLIGGWVAMWRPLEVFLYDWWPIRAEARLFDRLSAMIVRVGPSSETSPSKRPAQPR